MLIQMQLPLLRVLAALFIATSFGLSLTACGGDSNPDNNDTLELNNDEITNDTVGNQN